MDGSIHIPLAEEKIALGVEDKISGRVRVKTVTHEVVEHAEAELEHCDVEVKRVPVNEVVPSAPDVRVEGDTTIIPVLEEVLVVERRLLLREELHVTRKRDRETVRVPVTLRRQEAIVERDMEDQEENNQER